MAGMAMGGLAFGYIVIFGHTHAFRTPWEPGWGLLVTTYEFFLLCSAGLALLSAGTYLVGGERFQGVCLRMATLAIPVLVIGLALVAIELGQPTRLSMAPMLGPSFYRALWSEFLWFALALGLLVALTGRLRRKKAISAMSLGGGAFILTVFGIYQMGEVFRHFGHPPEWLTPAGSVDYLFAALISATALGALCLFGISRFSSSDHGSDYLPLLHSLRKCLIALLLFYGAWMAIVYVADATAVLPRQHPLIPFLLTGPLAIIFWALQVVVGFLLPLIILAPWRSAALERTALAAGLILTGQFFRSYDTVIGSQLETLHAESSFLVSEGLLAMTPCLPKTLVVIGAICLFLFVMTLAEKMGTWDERIQD